MNHTFLAVSPKNLSKEESRFGKDTGCSDHNVLGPALGSAVERGPAAASTLYDRPRTLPDSRSMSISKKHGLVARPGMVDMVPMMG